MRLRCPHCGTISTIRTTEVMSATISRHYVVCGNLDCGHTWRATTEADMTLSLSAMPDVTVALPLASHIRRDVISAQLRSPDEAEYTPRLPKQSTRDLFVADGPS